MKMYIERFGIVFVPENREDVEALNRVPKTSEGGGYDDYEAIWIKGVAERRAGDWVDLQNLPIGRALVIGPASRIGKGSRTASAATPLRADGM